MNNKQTTVYTSTTLMLAPSRAFTDLAKRVFAPLYAQVFWNLENCMPSAVNGKSLRFPTQATERLRAFHHSTLFLLALLGKWYSFADFCTRQNTNRDRVQDYLDKFPRDPLRK